MTVLDRGREQGMGCYMYTRYEEPSNHRTSLDEHYCASCKNKMADLGKSVDCQNGQIWLRFSIIHEIQVNQFLKLQIVRLHTIDDIRKQGAVEGERD